MTTKQSASDAQRPASAGPGARKKVNKQAILTAASELFIEGGADALSVREIARRAGLSTIGIYSHFEGKQGILDTLYVEGFEHVIDAMDKIDPTQTPKKILRQGASNYLEVARKYKAHYRLIFGERQPGYEPSEEAREVAAIAFAKLTEWIGHILPAGSKKADRENAAMQLWSFLHGTASLI